MRLIDAKALFDFIQKEKAWKQDTMRRPQYDKGKYDAYYEMLGIIEKQPTVDVVPVRCGECKFYHPECPYENFCIAQKMNDPKPDDFCSYGERKDGEK